MNCVALAALGSDMGIKVFDFKTGTVVFSKNANVGEEVVFLALDGVGGPGRRR